MCCCIWILVTSVRLGVLLLWPTERKKKNMNKGFVGILEINPTKKKQSTVNVN